MDNLTTIFYFRPIFNDESAAAVYLKVLICFIAPTIQFENFFCKIYLFVFLSGRLLLGWFDS